MLRGVDGDFCKGWRRQRQFRLRHTHPHGHHRRRAQRDSRGDGAVSAARVDFAAHLSFLALSGLATSASRICYFRALKLGEAARVAPIDKLSTVLVAIFGVAFLGERLSGPNWAGVALIACGALLVAYRG